MRLTAATDPGCKHEQNQDSYKAGCIGNDTAWVALCDGMGGVTSGDVASKYAVNYFETAAKNTLDAMIDNDELSELMVSAVNRCNAEIYEISRDEHDRIIMGTTVVFAVVKDARVHVVHAGDSRAYVITPNEMRQITRDHSMVQELLDSGKITAEQARNHPNKNIITSALGVEAEVKTDYNEWKLKKDDVLLLCSDGLSNMVDEQEIASIVRNSDFYQAAEKLVKRAVDLGGYDNITAVLLTL